ncbi:putative multidrug resistance-associated protein [Truncatella angustata]|uniref:Multidrug resistance-associated protein n=1 Tax=Truncatella angustata TaxID=152316 RepID=A0A9P8UDP1_9PEZI|nr:putative multidrug resistance-associated protein [Truncatella angustata]KAH6648013.1 putative multidrug resistance-associated protein [Truncatella angustata]
MSLLENYTKVCGDDTFGPTVPRITECRGGFDFTVTFEESILSLGPACLLLVILPGRLLSLWGRTCKTKGSWLHKTKLIGLAVLGALQAALLAFFSTTQASYRTILISSGTLQLCASILLAVLSHWEHRNAVRPSFLISAFLFLTSIMDAARARTQAQIEGQHIVASILIAIVIAKLVLLLIETKEKTRILLPEFSETSSELRSSLFTRAFFIWLIPVLSAGFKGVISSEDLPAINEKLSSEALTGKVESRWKKDVPKGSYALMFDVLLSFPKEFSIVLISNAIQVGLQICQPTLTQELVTFLESPTTPMNVGYGLLGGFFCISILNALLVPWGFHFSNRLMIKARGALVPMIYSKLMQCSGSDVNRSTAFTLMTTDVEKIVDTWWRLLDPWTCLLKISIGTYLLYRQLGAVCCVPIIVIFLTFILVATVGLKVPRHQNSWFQAIEGRINLTTHALGSLQSVKLLGLSSKMEAKIEKKREDELKTSQKFRITNCLALACVLISTAAYAPQILGPLITFGAYSIMRMVSHQTKFPVATAVTCLSILNLISTPAMQLLLAIPMGAQSVGSFARIQAFLQLSETPVLTTTTTSSSNDTNVIMTREKSAERDETHATQHHPEQPCGQDSKGSGPVPILSPNLYFTPNSFTAITGPIGCGKSTVLKGLLSSNEGQESCALPSRDIAYCSQTPWIYEGTIRDNIIGQSEMDDPWYQSVIQGCELDVDIGQAPEGDAASVGSRGSKLSGGQRQRIAIARALYSKKSRVIFDDVTSALDGHTLSAVADKIFGRTGILRSKGTSVVLATHAVQILQLADKVLLMGKNGEIIDSGTYDQLSKRHQSFVQRQVSDSPKQLSDSETSDAGTRLESSVGEYQTRLQTRVADLRRQKGDWRSYGFYIGSMGWLNFLIFVLSAIFYVLFNAIFGVWLTWWAEDTTDSHSLGYWLGLYATWAALIALGLLFTPIFFFTKLASKASKTMHTELLVTAMRAPMSTISSTEDMGSLVNRFSQDIRLCDWQLPFNILLTLFALLACLSSIGIAVAAVPYMAVGVPVLGAVLYLLQLLYLRTSRQLRLLEIELKAPIVSLFLDTIQGITTIHAFGWSQAYMQKNLSLLDSSQKPYYLLFCVQRWLILVLALMVTGIEAVVIGLAIALRTKVSAGLVGLAVVQVTSLTKGLSDLVMQWTEMETSLGAVSRTYRFSHDTPREDHFGEGTTTLPVEWPSGGSITFEGVSATYDQQTQNNSSLALSNITFAVKSGERVGICGRTGSGKSSLLAALLRLLPCHQGRILIDGVVISNMDPEMIRSKLNCVTQEPFLLDETIRENLGPWGAQVPDDEMIQALKQVDLWSKVESLGGLNAQLEGDLLSHGQRQLFCLARALLRKSSVLILDEPTGHIDPATDATIQRLIREGFPGRTIIMIAHRLQSLVEFDTVMVLDKGRLIEIGEPKTLLSDSASSFSALFRAGGSES